MTVRAKFGSIIWGIETSRMGAVPPVTPRSYPQPVPGPRRVPLHDLLVGRRPVRTAFLEDCAGIRVAAVANRHRDIPSQSGELGAGHRAALDQRSQLGIGQ